jgi:hypothetical protein
MSTERLSEILKELKVLLSNTDEATKCSFVMLLLHQIGVSKEVINPIRSILYLKACRKTGVRG